MTWDYERFKTAVLQLTGIDLNAYKERQMKRRIDALISKNGINDYEAYVHLLKTDKVKFEYPVVVKSPDSFGKKGISIANNDEEYFNAVK